jgi:dimethylargininase
VTVAITREVSPRFEECEITHIERTPIDMKLAHTQHQAYVNALRELGCKVIELPAEPDLPDSVFVEDTAFILPELAVITRPGAESRRLETHSITQTLAPLLQLVYVREPGTVDGGDVLVLGKKIYIGRSTRSNPEAIGQIRDLLREHGYSVTGIALTDCLHLKSAVTRVDDQTLLINRNWVDPACFTGFDFIDVDPSEPYAANCLPVANSIIFPAAFPKTSARLRERGYQVVTVDVSELAKAEGAVTCCSLILFLPAG